jgi:hypothetical protein
MVENRNHRVDGARFLTVPGRDIKTRIVPRIDRKSRDPFDGNRPSVRRGSRSASGRHARARGDRRRSVRTVRSGRRRCARRGNASRKAFGSPRAASYSPRRLPGARDGARPFARRAIENCRAARSSASADVVLGRSHQAFHRALPVAIRRMPFGKGEHELPGFVEGFDCPAVGEGEGLRERARPDHAFGLSPFPRKPLARAPNVK